MKKILDLADTFRREIPLRSAGLHLLHFLLKPEHAVQGLFAVRFVNYHTHAELTHSFGCGF